MAFAEPGSGHKPLWHQGVQGTLAEAVQVNETGRCGICNARVGQQHLGAGRYPS